MIGHNRKQWSILHKEFITSGGPFLLLETVNNVAKSGTKLMHQKK